MTGQESPSRRTVALLFASGLLAAGLSGCSGSASGSTTTTTTPAPPTETSASPIDDPAIGSISPEAEARILEILESSDVPSFAGAIVVNDQVVWAGGYGEQASPATVFSIGSIDKTFMATAVFQLVERGLLDLDADIDTYLPFEVRNPDFPDTAVTIGHLLLHRSGLVGDLPDSVWYDNDRAALEWAAEHLDFDLSANPFPDGTPQLRDYLALHFGGDDAGLWLFEPGSNWRYSNLGVHWLLALIIEEVAGRDPASYVGEHIFQPLGMRNSGFEAAEFTEDQLAVPYTRIDGVNTALPLTGQHASGRLRTSAADLAVFLGAHMNRGEFNGVRIMGSSSADTMHAAAFPLSGADTGQLPFRGVGYGWWLWSENRSGHTGGTPGFLAAMVMQETDAGSVGIVLMINVGCSLSCDEEWLAATFGPLREVLLEEARSGLSG